MTAAPSECEAAVPERYVTVQVMSGDGECSGEIALETKRGFFPALLASSSGLI